MEKSGIRLVELGSIGDDEVANITKSIGNTYTISSMQPYEMVIFQLINTNVGNMFYGPIPVMAFVALNGKDAGTTKASDNNLMISFAQLVRTTVSASYGISCALTCESYTSIKIVFANNFGSWVLKKLIVYGLALI